jgi:hypothetical protein
MLRLYVQADKKAHDAAAEVLKRFALVPMLQRDWQGTYFDVTPPKSWPVERREKFMAAIEQLDWL